MSRNANEISPLIRFRSDPTLNHKQTSCSTPFASTLDHLPNSIANHHLSIPLFTPQAFIRCFLLVPPPEDAPGQRADGHPNDSEEPEQV